MVATIANEKRSAIAMKLADIKALQCLAIQNEENLINKCSDTEIRKWLSEMLVDDCKNLTILENVIIQYGIKSEPRNTVQEMIKKVEQLIEENHLSFYEKIAQHELLKHQLAMAGIAVHKAGQVVGADVGKAIAPLHAVNFENRAHQERLQGVLEILSTRELTGQDPDQGIWARIQDSVAALSGIVGSVVSRGEHGAEMKVTDIVRMDHQKVRALFKEIKGSHDPQALTEFFLQLYRDLGTHAEAEEQTWYPALLKYADSMQTTEQAVEEQQSAKLLLEEIRGINPTNDAFKLKIADLEAMILGHIDHEERDLFDKLEDHFSHEELIVLGREFQQAKSRLQDTKYTALTQ